MGAAEREDGASKKGWRRVLLLREEGVMLLREDGLRN